MMIKLMQGTKMTTLVKTEKQLPQMTDPFKEEKGLPSAILFGGFFQTFRVVESLAARSIPVYVLNDRWAVARYSRLAKAIRLPEDEPYVQAATDFLTSDASNYLAGSVLLAAGDQELEVLSSHRETLARKFRLDLSNPFAQKMMLNKLATYKAAKEVGVTTPQFWEIKTEADLHQLRHEFTYPLIAKPHVAHVFMREFKRKFFVAQYFQELLDCYRVAERAGIDVVLLEMIPGPDSKLCSYYTYLDEEGNALFDFTKRVIRRYPVNMGLASYHITDHVEGIREPALRLFRHVGLQGLANAEFKYDDRDGRFKLIECNARFTAANTLVAKAGCDLGNFVYNRIVGIPQAPPTKFRSGLRLWDPPRDFRAFLELRERGEMTVVQWLSSIMHRNSIAYFSWRDPVPSILRLCKRARVY
jgi:D-aspartate ligase